MQSESCQGQRYQAGLREGTAGQRAILNNLLHSILVWAVRKGDGGSAYNSICMTIVVVVACVGGYGVGFFNQSFSGQRINLKGQLIPVVLDSSGVLLERILRM